MMWLPFFHSLSLKGPVPIGFCMIFAVRILPVATSSSVKPWRGMIGDSLGWKARRKYGTGCFSLKTTVCASGVSIAATSPKYVLAARMERASRPSRC